MDSNSDRSSRHSHESTSPESSSSSSKSPQQSPDQFNEDVPAREVKRRPKKPLAPGEVRVVHRRKGRVVSVLREQYALPKESSALYAGALNLGFSSSRGKLGSFALAAGLHHSLVRLAIENLTAIHNPSWHDLDLALKHLRNVGEDQPEEYLEVIMAAAAALGARRSNHSAITGITHKLENASLDELVELDLGKRRDAACLALADRACEMAEASKLLAKGDERAETIAGFLRVAIGSTVPSHPYMRNLNSYVNLHLKLKHVGSQEPPSRSAASDKCLVFDGASSLVYNEPLMCSDEELLESFGWSTVPGVDYLLSLTPIDENDTDEFDDQLSLRYRTAAVVALRSLARLQQQTSLVPVADVKALFASLTRLCDIQRAMAVGVVANQGDGSWNPLRQLSVMRLPIALESALLSQAKRHARGRVDDVWDAAQVRYVCYLKYVSDVLTGNTSTAIVAQLAATLLVVLADMVPDWTHYVILATVQHSQGHGPLAAATYTKFDLSRLHHLLKVGSSLFASLRDREREVANGIARHGLGPDTKSAVDPTSLLSFADANWSMAMVPVSDEIAQSMIRSALDEMLSA